MLPGHGYGLLNARPPLVYADSILPFGYGWAADCCNYCCEWWWERHKSSSIRIRRRITNEKHLLRPVLCRRMFLRLGRQSYILLNYRLGNGPKFIAEEKVAIVEKFRII